MDGKIKIFNDFKETTTIRPDFSPEGIHGMSYTQDQLTSSQAMAHYWLSEERKPSHSTIGTKACSLARSMELRRRTSSGLKTELRFESFHCATYSGVVNYLYRVLLLQIEI